MGMERTLLLIEDDDTTREVLTVLLEAEGWKTLAAPSGEDALRLLTSTEAPPAVILTDQQLPGIAGQDLAIKLRELLRARQAQAILLGMSASVQEAPGFDAMLRKPFQAADVRAIYEQLSSTHVVPGRDKSPYKSDGNLLTLDEAVCLKLEGQMGLRARDLYCFAMTDANDRLGRMSQALTESDMTSFHKEAHALKGSSGMIGARRLSALAAQAEKMTAAGSAQAPSHQLLTDMHRACDEIHLMLETRFPLVVEGETPKSVSRA